MEERGIVLVASLDPDFIRSDQASVAGMTTSVVTSSDTNLNLFRAYLSPEAAHGKF